MSTDEESSSDNDSEINDSMTTTMRTPSPGFLHDSTVSVDQNNAFNFITKNPPITKLPNEHDDQVNELNVAATDAVLALLHRYKINANHLTDQQLIKIINFVVTCTPYSDYLNP